MFGQFGIFGIPFPKSFKNIKLENMKILKGKEHIHRYYIYILLNKKNVICDFYIFFNIYVISACQIKN